MRSRPGRRARRLPVGTLALVVAVLAAAALPIQSPARPAGVPAPVFEFVPARFISVTYTEALGRLPDDSGWSSAVAHFRAHGCSARSLAAWALGVYRSDEMKALAYGPEALALVAHRGVLMREPTLEEYADWRSRLAAGTAFGELVAGLFSTSELAGRVSETCRQPGGLWLDRPPVAHGPELDQDILQAMLDNTPTGLVELPPRTVVRLDRMLVVRAGVTLRTAGVDDRRRYADMARLVRSAPLERWNRPLVQVSSGGRLEYVWVDGQRNRPENRRGVNQGVYARAGDRHTVVAHNKVSNISGGQSIRVGDDRIERAPCAGGATVADNLVTAYSSTPYRGVAGGPDLWTDGVFAQCDRTLVTRNEIVDTTDVAIVAMRHTRGPTSVVVTHNRALQAGNDSYGALAADAYREGTTEHPLDFRGTRFEHNVVWTGPHSQVVIALSAGTRPWSLGGVGTGPTFAHNTTGALVARVTQFLSVNGMVDVTTAGNGGNVEYVPAFGSNLCAVAPSVGNRPVFAGGWLQAHAVHDNTGCIRPS